MDKAVRVRLLIAAALTLALPCITLAQDGPLQVGYAVVTHETPTTEGLAVFETFGFRRGGETTQAGVLSSAMSTRGVVFATANAGLGRDLGLAIANPNPQSATVRLTLQRSDGAVISSRDVSLGVRQQTAQFISQLFSDRPEIGDFTGSILFESSLPVAVVGLRFRGINFSTLPFTNLSTATPVPPLPAGAGGAGAFILPQFAIGEGWASEIVVVNYSDSGHDLQVDLFRQDGSPLVATLNGQTQSSFTGLVVPAHGVLVLSVRDASGNSPF